MNFERYNTTYILLKKVWETWVQLRFFLDKDIKSQKLLVTTVGWKSKFWAFRPVKTVEIGTLFMA